MIKNKWKLAFWICFVFLILTVGFGYYSILDQGVTITYMKQGYENTENDLNSIIDIVNNSDFSKNSIEQGLKGHRFFDMMDFKMDTLPLERVELIFRNDTLKTIRYQW
ncbi:hypothetical protein DLK05_13930 [Ancylomarina longa]|uniref:Uncharacterized protein n=1 Tax=Ancylomarina longa TaxID=2487017 RepID=A0A434AG54_9BACT|nr:hypothetical protein DLK05_13930 [Ancylomarina longa]